MVQDFESTHSDLELISSGLEELSATNREVNERTAEIGRLGQVIHADMSNSERQSAVLREATETTLSQLSTLSLGHSRFDEILNRMRQRRDTMSGIFDELVKQGVNVFDRDYREVPNTTPKKYTVTYIAPLRERTQDLIDQWRKEVPGTAYCVFADAKGYLAVHHREMSQPMTGDPDKDLRFSRQERFYASTETELRRLQSEREFLLQTYLRDNGDVLVDFSMPIFVGEKYWGALAWGLLPSAFLGDND